MLSDERSASEKLIRENRREKEQKEGRKEEKPESRGRKVFCCTTETLWKPGKQHK